MTVLPAFIERPVDPWDQLPGENAHQYQRFLQYRNMPSIRRSLRNLQADLDVERTGEEATPRSSRYLAKLSRANHWPERVAAWDRQAHALIVEANRRALVEMHARHADIAKAAIGKVVQRLVELDASTMTVRDMLLMFDLAVKIERLSRGDTTSSVGVSAVEYRSTPGQREHTVEELTAILESLREAGVTDYRSTTDITVEVAVAS